jgi:hypothetical protein
MGTCRLFTKDTATSPLTVPAGGCGNRSFVLETQWVDFEDGVPVFLVVDDQLVNMKGIGFWNVAVNSNS